MDSYICNVCWDTYDPAVGDPKAGIEPGKPFESLPEDWFCPICSMTKEHFRKG